MITKISCTKTGHFPYYSVPLVVTWAWINHKMVNSVRAHLASLSLIYPKLQSADREISRLNTVSLQRCMIAILKNRSLAHFPQGCTARGNNVTGPGYGLPDHEMAKMQT